jgi:hypothetical protein
MPRARFCCASKTWPSLTNGATRTIWGRWWLEHTGEVVEEL